MALILNGTETRVGTTRATVIVIATVIVCSETDDDVKKHKAKNDSKLRAEAVS